MSIWGRRDGGPPTEEDQSQAEANDGEATAAGGEATAADATASPHGKHASPGAPAPAAGEAQAGTGAPVLTGVVIDGETVVSHPAATGTPGAQAGTDDAPAGPAVTEVQEPVVTGVQEPVVTGAPEPAPTAAAITPERWSEILVAFVDDPRASVKMAADAVDEAIGEFVNSVRARQRVLASSWQGGDTDTEQLRTALRDYRKLGQRVQQLDLGERTGG